MDEKISDHDEDSENYNFTIHEHDKNEFKRLDLFLSSKLPFSRSTIKKMFLSENISSEEKLSLNKMPPLGTLIEIDVPPPVETDLVAQNIPLDILFEDDHLVIVNKPAGMVVHPAPGHYSDTLVNAILFHCPSLKGIGAEKRPGIVHRLDMGTSGVMVIAKDHQTHEGLVNLFSTHDIDRKYEAIIAGKPHQKVGSITTTLGRHPIHRKKMAANVKNGKKAITHYNLLQSFDHFSHIELKHETGRTHQIRVHLSQILNTPILCDPLYGNRNLPLRRVPPSIQQDLMDYPHQLLHAKELGFVHPITKEKIHFTSPPPAIFQRALESFLP